MKRKTPEEDRTRPTLCHARRPTPRTGHAPRRTDNFSPPLQSNLVGTAFENRALEFLQRRRLRCVARNVRCRGGELDLVMRERDGTLVFVEVRSRTRRGHGGAAESVGWHKQQRLLCAARHYLARYEDGWPACRFDVVAFEAGRLVWLRDAFRADG